MPEIKEKPKTGRAKPRHSGTGLPKQADRLMKEKFTRELEQRREPEEGSSTYAVDQVEQAGRWAAGEVSRASTPSRRREADAETRGEADGRYSTPPGPQEGDPSARARRPRGSSPHAGGDPKGADRHARYQAPNDSSAPAVPFKDRAYTVSEAVPIRERPRMAVKEREKSCFRQAEGQIAPSQTSKQSVQPGAISEPGQASRPPQAISPSAAGGPSSAQAARRAARGPSVLREPPLDMDIPPRPDRQARSGRHTLPRPKTGTAGIKKRAAFPPGGKAPPGPKFQRGTVVKSIAMPPAPAAKQLAQKRTLQQAASRTGQAARRTAELGRKLAAAVVRAVASMAGALVGLVGGGVLLVVLVAVILIAAIASSPFGILFTEEPSGPDTVSVSQAVSTVNIDYNARLEALQEGAYDEIVVHGQGPDWAEVLAVFAVKTAGTDDGTDVATLDQNRVERLKAVFWDMTAITQEVETVEHPGDSGEEGWTEHILHITIAAKSADEMRAEYAFTDYQNSALDELLADRAALASLAGSPTITSADVLEVLNSLPDGLNQVRKNAVETALSLVGKVNYFWGGKSLVLGWDSRWGTLQKVTAAGNSTTGTYRPYGLDCSGMMDWVFYNITVGEYVLGRGGGATAQHSYCTPVSQAEAQPGDLAFYPDDSHVGIVVGRREDGKLLVCHCSSGQNNVVVTEFVASGFTALGRPDIFQ